MRTAILQQMLDEQLTVEAAEPIVGTRSWPSLPGLNPAGRYPMTTAALSTALATIQPAFTDAERLALAGFLAGYRGLTREAYTLDLRQFTTWCRARSLALFAVRRSDIETSPESWKPTAGLAPRSPGGWHHREVL
jgi:hypothetical protein